MNYALALLPICLLLATVAGAAEPDAKPAKPEVLRALAEIDPSAKGKGISVTCPKEISASAKGQHELQINFANLLQQEVFLTVRSWNFHDLFYDLTSKDGELFAGGGGGVDDMDIPDSYGLLRRLTACRYNELGQARLYGSGFAQTTGKVELRTNNLSDYIGGVVTVAVPVQGYFRATGKSFSTFVEFRLRVVE
ncbi:MAG: hypothetical protein RIC55_12455 [Pirellulaceae bacterium]